jgi:hypothetical protein
VAEAVTVGFRGGWGKLFTLASLVCCGEVTRLLGKLFQARRSLAARLGLVWRGGRHLQEVIVFASNS